MLSVASSNFDVHDVDLGRPFRALDTEINTIVPKFSPDGMKLVQVRALDGVPLMRHAPGADPERAGRAVSGVLFTAGAHPGQQADPPRPKSQGAQPGLHSGPWHMPLAAYDPLAFASDAACADWHPMPSEIMLSRTREGDLRTVHRLLPR